MASHHRLEAVRAHPLEMAGDTQAAIARYRNAAMRTTSIPEHDCLSAQASRLETPTAPLRRAELAPLHKASTRKKRA
jgi:hypothetical protein